MCVCFASGVVTYDEHKTFAPTTVMLMRNIEANTHQCTELLARQRVHDFSTILGTEDEEVHESDTDDNHPRDFCDLDADEQDQVLAYLDIIRAYLQYVTCTLVKFTFDSKREKDRHNREREIAVFACTNIRAHVCCCSKNVSIAFIKVVLQWTFEKSEAWNIRYFDAFYLCQ